MSAEPEILLKATELSVRFGGVLAVNKVSFDVRRGEVFTLIGPNGAGKTTVFNLISRIYTPTTGSIQFEGRVLTEQPPHAIAALGIARTFQNIELFEHATVLQNLLIGHHIHRGSGFWSNLLFTPTALRPWCSPCSACSLRTRGGAGRIRASAGPIAGRR